jgi:diguanylate cyclase (GGDEF)-like protein/PAS domain S-box-containing protein
MRLEEIKKVEVSPVLRLSFGLVALVVSLTLAAEFFGFIPDKKKIALDARTQICETLAVQLSWGASRNDTRMIQTTLDSVVARNGKVLSAALRTQARGVIAEAGDHEKFWVVQEGSQSTPTHIQVPIMRNQQKWGVVELSFAPLQGYLTLADWKKSTYGFLAFITLTGSVFFWLFLRRALKELDPSRVVPERVKAAFDALAEGVIIMDEKEQIVLANGAFAKMVGQKPKSLIGRVAGDLDWRSPKSGDQVKDLPWQSAMKNNDKQMGIPLMIAGKSGKMRALMVNGASIADGKGETRGALATFDDVSDVQKKNSELQLAMERLETSREEVKRQNKELTYLATRDPLTGCLNRRATFERFDVLFKNARETKGELCCIMVDIDHFKLINDRYGHSAGDKVIKFVAKQLRVSARDDDLVSRYGGEEFCLILPGMDLESAAQVAERLRESIKHDFHDKFTSSRDLTISLGVAALGPGVSSPADLINLADKALYAAKGGGRNRVIRWDDQDVNTASILDAASSIDTADQTMLIEKLLDVDADATQTSQVQVLNDRVIELDAMIEEKSVKLHRKHGFDELTGLPNRILFYDRATQALAAAKREGCTLAMLYLDVDLFRRVKDTLGPVVDDHLIKAATARVASVLRAGDMVTMVGQNEEVLNLSRLGTNEFGIALTDLDGIESVTWIIQRLFDALSKPIQVDKEEIYANCAIGISVYPDDGDDVETLVRYASTARHHAQASEGRHKYKFYAQDMNTRSFQQMHLEGQLREAISKEEFVLHYQPAFDVQTREVKMLETLVRWKHPELGLLGPDMFIPIAEHTGFINEIGDWVLRTACMQMKHWVSHGLNNVRIAVNLSAVQLRSEDIVDRILAIVDEVGLDTKYLELEITETALMDSIELSNQVFQALRSKGIKIAIDDFGTGYSSLSHLKHLNVDSLKIDRSFIRDVNDDPKDAAVVGAIIAMAKLMGLSVVAEGVETKEQLDFLRKRQCGTAQGFLLGKPTDAMETGALLATDIQASMMEIQAERRRGNFKRATEISEEVCAEVREVILPALIELE